MSTEQNASNTNAPTQFLKTSAETYAYRRFGSGPGLPLLCLQHFTGTLDNWDPAVTDPLASGREVILGRGSANKTVVRCSASNLSLHSGK
jgi:hypothetical protein